jgi:ABC-type spermidine/putrescine transport system permease subunit II
MFYSIFELLTFGVSIRWLIAMIVSFGDKATSFIWQGFQVRSLPASIQEIARS